MKQKFLLSLMLLCMSLCSAPTWAELVRPTMPEATLEPGTSYYLYNVEADLFAQYNNGFKVNEQPTAIEITENDGDYKMKAEGYYLGRSSSSGSVSTWGSYARSTSAWSIIEADDSYLIRHYNSEQYLGWLGDNATEIKYNRDITGAVHWKLLPADAEGDRYVAALKLYKELSPL